MPKPSRRSKPKKKPASRGRSSAGRDRRMSFRERMKKSENRRFSKGIFKVDLEGVDFWKCDEGQHIIDIIPAPAGPNNPMDEEGTNTYVLELSVHRDVGDVEGQMVVCPKENFNQPCPICEHRTQLAREGDADEELLKALRPSAYPRSIYNVICYDSRAEEEKGIQVWHTSNYLFEQHLLKLAKGPQRRGGSSAPDSFVEFACPVEGKSISFSTEGKKMNKKHMALQFMDRDYEIDDATLEEAHVLDDLIKFHTYDEIYALYWGEEGEGVDDDGYEEEEDERPARRGAGRRASDRRAAPARRGRVEEEDEAEEDEGEWEDEAEEAEEEYEEEEGDTECPAGGVFGEDCNQYDECESCELWDDCYEASNVEEEQPRRSRKPKPKKPASRRKPASRKPKKPAKRSGGSSRRPLRRRS